MNIVITGGSKGIGNAIARGFAGIGHNICLVARNPVDLKAAVEELEKEFPLIKVTCRAADLSVKTEAIETGRELSESLSQIDILINNAGQFVPGSIYNEPDGNLEEMMDINLFSSYHLTRAIIPSMINNKKGHIFNICSIASLNAYANGGSYSISKFALMGFSKNLREEMKPFNIKVTSVYPGAVYTASWEGSGVEKSRIMEVNDIATMIVAASQLSPQACPEEIVLRPILGDMP